MCKRWVTEQVGDHWAQNCWIFKVSRDEILEGTNQNKSHHLEDNPNNAMFMKDYTTVIGRLVSSIPVLEDSFIKVGTDIAYSEEVCTFVDSIPEVGQTV